MKTTLAKLIAESAFVKFGSSAQAPSLHWIERAEDFISTILPDSYKWFIANYGGGEVRGDEIFSIYEMEPDAAIGGDLAYQWKLHLEHLSISATEIPVCATDFGELFVMESSEPAGDGEFPVYRKTGFQRELYSSNFVEFLIRFIQE